MATDNRHDAQEVLGRGLAQLGKALELVRRAVMELDDIATKAEAAGVDPKALLMGPLQDPYNDLLDYVEDTVRSLEEFGLYDPVGEDDDDDSDAEDEEFDVDMGEDDGGEEDDDE
jgi:hypothetical protein